MKTFITTIATFFVVAGLARKSGMAESLRPIDLQQIQVHGEIGRRIDMTLHNNLMVLDVENDFLKPFREKKGKIHDYIAIGKLIDSLVRMAAYTGDEKVLARKRYVIDELIKTQEPDGYIGMMMPAHRMWREWDIHEMSYIIYALVSDYQLLGEEKSLEAAKKAADYIVQRWGAEPNQKPGSGRITVFMAVTGLEEALTALAEATGDPRYLDFCEQHRKLAEWDTKIVIGRWNPHAGHAYAYMSRCLAQLQLHQSRPDERLLGQSRRVMDFITKQDGMAITGGCGQHECWDDSQSGDFNLGETCATTYLIRLMDGMLQREGASLYGDIAERVIFNAFFAVQSSDGRSLRYYTPFEGPRAYWKGDSYCCPNNFRRTIVDLPGMVYYQSNNGQSNNGQPNNGQSDQGIAVNLYTPSTAEFELADGVSLRVEQETDFPSSGQVILRLHPSTSAKFTLRLRIPRWCSEAKVVLNGQPVDQLITGGSFFAIHRNWQAGDEVRLELPMRWRFVRGRKAQAGRVAVMRGPLVFCLNPKRQENQEEIDLRSLCIDPSSVEGPLPDDSVRPGGLACRVKASVIGLYRYPPQETDRHIFLTEFADADGQATYFHVADPKSEQLSDDELVGVETE